MGINEDLREAAKLAVREMIDFLVTEKHLTRDDAYQLASVAADFDITQLVDGTKGVHAMIPKAIFLIVYLVLLVAAGHFAVRRLRARRKEKAA